MLVCFADSAKELLALALAERGFEPREAQLQLIDHVFATEPGLIPSIRAGTGSGKSLAELAVASAWVGANSGTGALDGERSTRVLIIAGVANSLVNQLVHSDGELMVAAFQKQFNRELKIHRHIGSTNFVCLSKVRVELAAAKEQSNVVAQEACNMAIRCASRFEFPEYSADTAAMLKFAASSLLGCDGDACEGCPEQIERKAAREADIVVTNATTGALLIYHGLCGSYDYVIVDESHFLPAQIVDAASFEIPDGDCGAIIEKLFDGIAKAAKTRNMAELVRDVRLPVTKVAGHADTEFRQALVAEANHNRTIGRSGYSVNSDDVLSDIGKEVASRPASIDVKKTAFVWESWVDARRALANHLLEKVAPLFENWGTNGSIVQRIESAAFLIERPADLFESESSSIVRLVSAEMGWQKRALLVVGNTDQRKSVQEWVDELDKVVLVSGTPPSKEELAIIGLNSSAVGRECCDPLVSARERTHILVPKPTKQLSFGRAKGVLSHDDWVLDQIEDLVKRLPDRQIMIVSGATSRRDAIASRIRSVSGQTRDVFVDSKHDSSSGTRWVEEAVANPTGANGVLVASSRWATGFDPPWTTAGGVVVVDRYPLHPPSAVEESIAKWCSGISNAWDLQRRKADRTLHQSLGRLVRRAEHHGILVVLDPRHDEDWCRENGAVNNGYGRRSRVKPIESIDPILDELANYPDVEYRSLDDLMADGLLSI